MKEKKLSEKIEKCKHKLTKKMELSKQQLIEPKTISIDDMQI